MDLTDDDYTLRNPIVIAAANKVVDLTDDDGTSANPRIPSTTKDLKPFVIKHEDNGGATDPVKDGFVLDNEIEDDILPKDDPDDPLPNNDPDGSPANDDFAGHDASVRILRSGKQLAPLAKVLKLATAHGMASPWPIPT